MSIIDLATLLTITKPPKPYPQPFRLVSAPSTAIVPQNIVKSFNPVLELDTKFLPEWLWAQLVEFSQQQPFGDSRVQLWFACDGYFAPREVVVKLFNLVRSSGIKLITSNYVRGAILGSLFTKDEGIANKPT